MSEATPTVEMTVTMAAPIAIRRSTAASGSPRRWANQRTPVAPPTIAIAMTPNDVTASYGSSPKGSTARNALT